MKLIAYIKGLRHGKEAQRLERESMQDPFLADAIDGYHAVEDDHERRIEELRRRIGRHSSRTISRKIPLWSAAACLLLGIGVALYFLPEREAKQSEDSFLTQESALNEPMATPSSSPPSPPSVTAQPSEDVPQLASAKTSAAKPETAKNASKSMEIQAEESLPSTLEMSESEITAETAKADDRLAIVNEESAGDEIKGKVVDREGEPIVGAFVFYEGTNIGTSTDLEGNFSLKREPGKKKLTANFIGFENLTLPISNDSTMLFAMNEDNSQLEEVVVVGYGTRKRSSNVGTFSRVNSKKAHTPRPVIGNRKYNKYLKENLQRPTDDDCREARGEVVLKFRVGSDGRPAHIRVAKELCPSADAEAIRLLEKGPDWTTGFGEATLKVKF